jgi:hypothetical protein
MNAQSRLRSILAAVFAAALCSACASGKSTPEVTHDGLQLVPDSKMEHAWVKPGEDFSQYDMIGLLDCYVAFKKGWRMSHPDIRRSDMQKVRQWLTAEFREVFTAKLLGNGYSIATAPKKNVLLVRPALIDLEILEPDTESDVSSMAFTTSTGSVKLYVELYDAESSEILARAADRRQVNHIGDVEVSSFVTNSDDARRLLKHWAGLLIDEINAAHGKTGN